MKNLAKTLLALSIAFTASACDPMTGLGLGRATDGGPIGDPPKTEGPALNSAAPIADPEHNDSL